jgi:hypothetical protein
LSCAAAASKAKAVVDGRDLVIPTSTARRPTISGAELGDEFHQSVPASTTMRGV